jgi:hypothetical protein
MLFWMNKMSGKIPNPKDLISYIDIGTDSNTDLIRWAKPGTTIFRLDIVATRASANDQFFQKMEKSESRTLFLKRKNIVITVAADDSVQYQYLEAVIETIFEDFQNSYGNLCCDIISGMTNLFDGFHNKIPKLLEIVQNEKVKWLPADCRLCNQKYYVCVKNTLIEKTTKFPVSLVYFHKNHGLCLYIDANFKIRGEELVSITG